VAAAEGKQRGALAEGLDLLIRLPFGPTLQVNHASDELLTIGTDPH
jgi:hypothetical protein